MDRFQFRIKNVHALFEGDGQREEAGYYQCRLSKFYQAGYVWYIKSPIEVAPASDSYSRIQWSLKVSNFVLLISNLFHLLPYFSENSD